MCEKCVFIIYKDNIKIRNGRATKTVHICTVSATTSDCVNFCKIEKGTPFTHFGPKKTSTSMGVKLCIYAQLL